MSRWRVLVTSPQLQRTIEAHRMRFDEHEIELLIPPVVQQLSEDELIALLPGVDGIVVGDDPLSARVLAAADRLRVISKWGVGIDNIDVSAAGERGIRVANTPGAFGAEVADVVIGYLILLARHLHAIDSAVRNGMWFKPEGVSLAGRTMGVVGLGDIGQAVVRRAIAMGMRVLGADSRTDKAEIAGELGAEVLRLPALLQRSHVVSLNCPLTPETRHMIDGRALDSMRKGAWIINTARGGLIDEVALVAALERSHIAGAALDVFETEPLPTESPLRRLDRVILGAHNSSNTAEAVHRTSVRAIDNLLAGLFDGGAA
jgi:D-3-phosphoglycerate dehydrogenase